MTAGGAGLPRLQELSYLEEIIKAVADELPLEQIRLRHVEHLWAIQNAGPGEPPDPSTYRAWRSDQKKKVTNVTDSLKELMRLGFINKAILPSSGKSAYAHAGAMYELTPAGRAWASRLRSNRRQAYEELIPALISAHPGLRSYLAAVGTAGTGTGSLVIPLLRWGQLPADKRSQGAYRVAIGPYVASALNSAELGWTAEATEITEFVDEYLNRILARSQSHDGRHPFSTIRSFTQTCEEALVKLAFERAGCSIDYVSVEIARRWCRWLGLASFSYHAPGPTALRFWSTAQIRIAEKGVSVSRRAGDKWRNEALEAIHTHCQDARASGRTYVPVWEVRAAVCWKLRIVDDEFDRAVTDMIAGQRGELFNWRIHLDQVSIGSIPSSAAPFVLTTAAAGVRSYNVLTVVPRIRSTNLKEKS